MKKIYNYTVRIVLAAAIFLNLLSCTDMLDEKVYSSLTPNNFYQTKADIEAGLISCYYTLSSGGWLQFAPAGTNCNMMMNEQSTDILFTTEEWGGLDPTTGQGQIYTFMVNAGTDVVYENYKDAYRAVAMCNSVIEGIEAAPVDEEYKKTALAEAKTLRALFYSHILKSWGNAPLVTSVNVDPLNLPVQIPATEMAEFLETELLESIPNLENNNYIGTDKYGRITQAGAQAILAKLYLHLKEWQKCADVCKSIIDNENYGLHSDYLELFSIENSRSGPANEMLVLVNFLAEQNVGNVFAVHAYAWGQETPTGVAEGWAGIYAHRAFYDTFDEDDKRREGLTLSYNTEWGPVSYEDRAVIIKYAWDPNLAAGQYAGNDAPIIRLADIYLAYAECLNELNGPTQAAINAINSVRERAFDNDNPKPVSLNDFSSKDELRSHILKERGWELYIENTRKEDLIRHGEYINQALNRGITNAKSYHVLLPFPTNELDSNPNMQQNDGY